MPAASATALTRRRAIAALAASAATGLGAPAAAQFRIEISGVGATQLPVAVADFRNAGGNAGGSAGAADALPLNLAAVLRANLDRSGLFRTSAAPANLDETSTPVLADWKAQGQDALVAGSVRRLADGRYDIRYKLWDSVKGEDMLGQTAVVPAADLRLAAHRIADEVHQRLTGERGVYATRIAYVLRQGRTHTLHVTDADGEGGQIAVTSREPLISPAWAPDGNRLAVALSQGGSTQLYTLPSGGGSPQRLTSSNAIDTEPVYSADGRSIYFVSDRGGGPQIYRVAAGGGSAERITFDGDYNISPAISPDGRTLAFIGRVGSAYRLMTQELDTGSLRTLSDTRDDESPGFAPNGRLLVYATRIQGTDTLMTTTLDGKIKARLASTGADMREPAWGPWTAASAAGKR